MVLDAIRLSCSCSTLWDLSCLSSSLEYSTFISFYFILCKLCLDAFSLCSGCTLSLHPVIQSRYTAIVSDMVFLSTCPCVLWWRSCGWCSVNSSPQIRFPGWCTTQKHTTASELPRNKFLVVFCSVSLSFVSFRSPCIFVLTGARILTFCLPATVNGYKTVLAFTCLYHASPLGQHDPHLAN